MFKILILLYGFLSYAVGMAGLAFFLLYVGGWGFMPLDVNATAVGPLGMALVINIGLILLWGVQHTVMARPAFKELWTKVIPKPMERSTYVLISGILMIYLPLNWQGIDGMLWDVDNSTGRVILLSLYGMGCAIAVITTFLINHFELFGLQQVWRHYKDHPEPAPSYTEKLFYKVVRHPLQFGILMALWFLPTMSMTLFSLSGLMTVYIFIGLYYEERDLLNSLGDDYADYKNRVRQIIPIPK
jgi:protein-S-isoprenylcysteine O-methyltransferase Ste14